MCSFQSRDIRVEELHQIQITRQNLEKWMFATFFQEVAVGMERDGGVPSFSAKALRTSSTQVALYALQLAPGRIKRWPTAWGALTK